jgi:hypothetical protein
MFEYSEGRVCDESHETVDAGLDQEDSLNHDIESVTGCSNLESQENSNEKAQPQDSASSDMMLLPEHSGSSECLEKSATCGTHETQARSEDNLHKIPTPKATTESMHRPRRDRVSSKKTSQDFIYCMDDKSIFSGRLSSASKSKYNTKLSRKLARTYVFGE